MFGFVIGALCLVGLIKVAGGHSHGYGRRWHHHGPHDGAARRRWALRFAFRHLATTAAQEKVILEAADALDAQREKLFDEARASRANLADALRAETFDDAAFHKAFERQQATLAQLQDALLENAKKVFDVLQPDQRRTVASALEGGFRSHRGHRGCHGFHHAHAC